MKAIIKVAYDLGYRINEEGVPFNPKGKKLSYSKDKYPSLHVFQSISIYAHHLAAYCFYGDAAFEAPCIRHKNGNLRDVSKSNILLGTYSDNELDKDEEIRIRSATIAARSTRRYKEKLRCENPNNKICSKCKGELPKERFTTSIGSLDGRASQCNICRSNSNKARKVAISERRLRS